MARVIPVAGQHSASLHAAFAAADASVPTLLLYSSLDYALKRWPPGCGAHSGPQNVRIRSTYIMRVLVLTQVLVYPADAGPKLKTLEVLRYLATRHDVVYCTFVRSEQEERDAAELRELCRRVVTVPLTRAKPGDARFMLESLLTGDSFLLRRDYRAAMWEEVSRLLEEEQIDAIHVDQLNMMRFVPKNWEGSVILDEHNAVWQVV